MRSRLRASDAALVPPFTSFMDQEIHAEEQAVRGLVTLFLGGSEAARAFRPPADFGDVPARLDALRDEYDDGRMRRLFLELADDPAMRAMVAAAPEAITRRRTSTPREAGFFADVLPMARDRADTAAVRVLDAMLEAAEVRDFAGTVERFGRMCLDATRRRGRIYAICCGSSYHAAKAASLFFNEIAGVEIQAMLPGDFRGQSARSLRDGDLVIAVSQSGETKDLIDVLDDVIASGRDVGRISLVNNLNSTIAEEKSDLVVPLRCGPEIAVPATKSFMNQMALFFCLAAASGGTPCRRDSRLGRRSRSDRRRSRGSPRAAPVAARPHPRDPRHDRRGPRGRCRTAATCARACTCSPRASRPWPWKAR